MREDHVAKKQEVALNNSIRMPLLGLGVFKCLPGEETERVVRDGLEVGYRLIDTARFYANERDVGRALRASGLPRDQVFITTKLHHSDLGYDSTLRAFDASLKELGLDYVDLYLVHWPLKSWRFYTSRSKIVLNRLGWPVRMRLKTWRAMERILADGKCRAIGVSNYTIRHLEELLSIASVIPAVNQVEFTPFCNQRELLQFCNLHGIRIEAYSPLTRGNQLHNPALLRLASKYRRSTAQLLIRWALQQTVIAIPKACSVQHLKENFEVFDFSISAEDMESLNGLNENLHYCWDPSDIP